MEPGTIIHPGVIEEVSGDKILVKILSQSACSTCLVKGSCSLAEVEEKIIEVDAERGDSWKPGQQVMVRMQQSLGLKAVFLGYLMPLLVLVVSVVVFLSLLKNEGWAALLSILMLGPYYAVLYFFRGRLKKTFSFRIEEQDR